MWNENEGRQSESAGSKNCICNGPACICCLDFNISFIDLGGPGNWNFLSLEKCSHLHNWIFYSKNDFFPSFISIGCVRLKYLSPEEGIAINVSYGESLLHNEVVKGPDPAPSCLNIFAKLAQICARFSGLLPTDDGMRGCINLEPMLLGETQLELPIGCFRMGPDGMHVIESPTEVIKEQEPESVDESDKIDGNGTISETDALAGISATDILAAVNESAEQGIAIISNWLGLLPNGTSEETAEQVENTVNEQPPISQTNSPANSGHVVFA